MEETYNVINENAMDSKVDYQNNSNNINDEEVLDFFESLPASYVGELFDNLSIEEITGLLEGIDELQGGELSDNN